jgi:hypothetical protein
MCTRSDGMTQPGGLYGRKLDVNGLGMLHLYSNTCFADVTEGCVRLNTKDLTHASTPPTSAQTATPADAVHNIPVLALLGRISVRTVLLL